MSKCDVCNKDCGQYAVERTNRLVLCDGCCYNPKNGRLINVLAENKQLQQDKAELLKALEVSTRAWDQYFKNGEMFDYDEYESHEKLLESMK